MLRKIFFFFLILLTPLHAFGFNVEKLSKSDIEMVRQIVSKLQPLIQERDAKGDLATLTFKELDAPLTKEERKFLKQFKSLSRKETGTRIPWRGLSVGEKDLIPIKGQKVNEKVRIRKDGKLETVVVKRTLPPQFLPLTVYQKYFEMMAAMEKDIGKRLYVESGYRSSAFQLYLFVYYLSNHHYSIKETARFVAVPGYSEHGCPKYQAIDFINVDGVNGDPKVEEFEKLPENKWLHKNAHRFGFVLSYPKDGPAGITYEPWHWRYDPKEAEKKESRKIKKKTAKISAS